MSMVYPHPVNSNARIQLCLPKAEHIRLTVLDIQGRQVEVLVNEKRDAGIHQVEWNPQLPGGIYFYQIEAGEFKETKKMILLR